MELAVIGGLAMLGYLYKEAKARDVVELIDSTDSADNVGIMGNVNNMERVYDALDGKTGRKLERFQDSDIPLNVHPDSLAKKFYAERTVVNYSNDFKQTKLDLFTGNAGSVYAKPNRKEVSAMFKPIESATLISQSGKPATALVHTDESRYWVRDNRDFTGPSKDSITDLPLTYAEVEIKLPNTSTKTAAALPHPFSGRFAVPKNPTPEDVGMSTNIRISEKQHDTSAVQGLMSAAASSVKKKAMMSDSSQTRVENNTRANTEREHIGIASKGVHSEGSIVRPMQNTTSVLKTNGTFDVSTLANSSRAGVTAGIAPEYSSVNRKIVYDADRNNPKMFTSVVNPSFQAGENASQMTRMPKILENTRVLGMPGTLNPVSVPDLPKQDKVLESFEDINANKPLNAYARNINNANVFVQFPQRTTSGKQEYSPIPSMPRLFHQGMVPLYPSHSTSNAHTRIEPETDNPVATGRTLPPAYDHRTLFEHDRQYQTRGKNDTLSSVETPLEMQGSMTTMSAHDYRIEPPRIGQRTRIADMPFQGSMEDVNIRTIATSNAGRPDAPIETRTNPTRVSLNESSHVDAVSSATRLGTLPPSIYSTETGISREDDTTRSSDVGPNARFSVASHSLASHSGTSRSMFTDSTGMQGNPALPNSSVVKYPEVANTNRQAYDPRIADRFTDFPVNTGSTFLRPVTSDMFGEVTHTKAELQSSTRMDIPLNPGFAVNRPAPIMQDVTRPKQTLEDRSNVITHPAVAVPSPEFSINNASNSQVTRFTDRGISQAYTTGPAGPVILKVPASIDGFTDNVRVPNKPLAESMPGPNIMHSQMISVVDGIDDSVTKPMVYISKDSGDFSTVGGHAVFGFGSGDVMKASQTREKKIQEVTGRQTVQATEKHPLA